MNKRIGSRLKHRREELLIGKAELARLTGVSVQTITRIEKGASCRVQTMHKLSLSLGLSL